MNVYWFLGFSEGEGNFSVLFSTKQRKKRRDTKYVWARPVYQLVQAEEKVIDDVKEFLEQHGIKSKYTRGKQTYYSLRKTPKITRDKWLLQVFETQSLRKMVKLLDSLGWHTQKWQDFEKWKKCIAIIMEHPNLHRTGRKSNSDWKQHICDLLRINHIAQDMNVAGRRRVWTTEHLINHLKMYKPYKDFDFVKKLKVDRTLEENLRILGYEL